MNPSLTKLQRTGIASAALPLFAFIAITVRRPDVVAPLMDDRLGVAWVFAALLLMTIHAVALWGTFRLVNATAKTEGSRRGFSLLGFAIEFLLVGAPAIFLVLFGPIAFALMSAPQ